MKSGLIIAGFFALGVFGYSCRPYDGEVSSRKETVASQASPIEKAAEVVFASDGPKFGHVCFGNLVIFSDDDYRELKAFALYDGERVEFEQEFKESCRDGRKIPTDKFRAPEKVVSEDRELIVYAVDRYGKESERKTLRVRDGRLVHHQGE